MRASWKHFPTNSKIRSGKIKLSGWQDYNVQTQGFWTAILSSVYWGAQKTGLQVQEETMRDKQRDTEMEEEHPGPFWGIGIFLFLSITK